MTEATYIIGGPASGKSTLMKELLQPWQPGPYVRLTRRELFGHYLHGSDGLGVHLGHLREGAYPGTDALSLSVAPQAMIWLESLPLMGFAQVLGEGMRLSHIGFLRGLHEVADLTVIHLQVDPELARERRAARGGKQLSEQFCKTATTKADNVAQVCRDAGIRVISKSG